MIFACRNSDIFTVIVHGQNFQKQNKAKQKIPTKNLSGNHVQMMCGFN